MEKILTKHFFRFSCWCQTNLTLNRILQWLVEVNASHWWRLIGGWHAMLRREGRRRFAWTWNLFQLFSFEKKPQAASAACKRPQMCKVGLEQGKYEDSDDDVIHIFILWLSNLLISFSTFSCGGTALQWPVYWFNTFSHSPHHLNFS